jgi:heme-degrading monooxygenase HmoA
VREAHGLLAELVLDPHDGDTVVVTVWPSHEVFDAWIATPERDRRAKQAPPFLFQVLPHAVIDDLCHRHKATAGLGIESVG